MQEVSQGPKLGVFFYPFVLVSIIWAVFLVDVIFGLDLYRFGILPREASGLIGIAFSPFLHGSFSHIISNSVPLFVLLAFLIFFYKSTAVRVLFIGTFITGLLVWIMSPSKTYHIGASGVIYMLVGYLFFGGVFRKNFLLMALSLLIVFLYGGMIWGVLPIYEGVSWESHLFGGIIGFVLAYLYRNVGLKEKKYDWEDPEYQEEYEEEFWKLDYQEDNENNIIQDENKIV